MFGALSNQIKLTFECILACDLFIAANDDLPNVGLNVAGALAEHRVVLRDVAPTQHMLAFFADDLLKNLHALLALRNLRRHEDAADAVKTGLNRLDAALLEFTNEECMGDLDQDAGAVASVGLATA